MYNKAFLIVGPESSGTKLFAQILIGAGCAGDDDHYQKWDWEPPTGDLIVWRRSVPHAEWYPDIVGMVETLRGSGYRVFAYVMTRDWYAMLNSQVLTRLNGTYEFCYRRVQRAYPYIFMQLGYASVPYAVVSYEALTRYSELERRQYIESMLALFGLQMGKLPDIYSGNAKHYEGGLVDKQLADIGIERPGWLGGDAEWAVHYPKQEPLTKIDIRPEIHC
jgi:hypothetical protein